MTPEEQQLLLQLIRHPNFRSFLEQQSLIEAVKFGQLNFSTEIHNGTIKSIAVFGQKKQVFNRSPQDVHDNDDAVIQILNRIRASIDESSDDQTLTFTVHTKGKLIREVSWDTKRVKSYRQLDKTLKVQ